MLSKILLVNDDPFFSSYVSATIENEFPSCNVLIAKSGRRGTALIKELRTVRYVLMTLAIPRIADGYIFLSRVANKIFPSKKIIVLVQNRTEQVVSSLALHGVEHVYSSDKIDTVLSELHTTLCEPNVLSLDVDLGKVQELLNEVVGPAGSFIFEESYKTCKDISNAVLLVESIVQEIGDKKRGEQFYTLCQRSGVLFGGNGKRPLALY